MKNWLLITIEFILLILFLVECIFRTIIYPFYWKIWKPQFITIKWYHALNNRYRKAYKESNYDSDQTNYLGIMLILSIFITSCSDKECSDRVLYDTKTYVIDNCEYIGTKNLLTNSAWLTHKGNCSNHSTNPRSYQIQYTDSVNYLYDGNILIGVLPCNRITPSDLDLLINQDNQ